jgi:cytosine/uracil/thiamine/allantoin permease
MTFRGPFWRRFWLALAAVIAGNAIYFAIQRFLPPGGRHEPFRIDLGLIVDSWICLILFNVLLLVFRSKQ